MPFQEPLESGAGGNGGRVEGELERYEPVLALIGRRQLRNTGWVQALAPHEESTLART